MFGWIVVVIILVAEITLLAILLLPMPLFLLNAIISMMNKLQKPLWLILLVLTALLASSWFDMEKTNATLEKDQNANSATSLGADVMLHNKKWRAERNFYLVAYTWTLMAILLRAHSVLAKSVKLESDLNQMVAIHGQTSRPANSTVTTDLPAGPTPTTGTQTAQVGISERKKVK
eukprot:TRINITY_DN16172_c0_g1_i1.p1 TRINITY_DN16172_c0_g1~~TRINITY_DN16172_c0_g1_i1.p1  ORF type:complete len:175 (+),score=46.23 TRINITY_DN16172_c0_g1_i1:109-633(+)